MKKVNKRISVLVSLMLVVTMLFGTSSVWAGDNTNDNALRKLRSSSDIVKYATGNKVNIIIYDAQNNISGEFHSDVLEVKYNVDPTSRTINEVTNSEGIRMEIKQEIMTTYDAKGKVVNQELLKIKSTTNRSINNINIDNLKKQH